MATDTSIERFRRVVEAAYTHLEARRQEVNDLNVFPVPDGDTGDNMALTMRHVLEELDRLEVDGDGDPKRADIVQHVARAALMGARGNSGVILSQIVRGAAAGRSPGSPARRSSCPRARTTSRRGRSTSTTPAHGSGGARTSWSSATASIGARTRGGSRGSATRCWWSATRPRSRSTSTPTT